MHRASTEFAPMTAPSALPSGLAVRHQWRSFGRRGLLNQITCVTIAGVFYLLSGTGSSFIINWSFTVISSFRSAIDYWTSCQSGARTFKNN